MVPFDLLKLIVHLSALILNEALTHRLSYNLEQFSHHSFKLKFYNILFITFLNAYICFPLKIKRCCGGGIPSFSSTLSLIRSTLSVGSISISILIETK